MQSQKQIARPRQGSAHQASEAHLRSLPLGSWLWRRGIGYRHAFRSAAAVCSIGLAVSSALAQGVLTVTPGRNVANLAGNGAVGYRGDGAVASSAQLARPAGIAYDAAGDLFLADANNHVIRAITPQGVISTVAGTGIAGFGGDRGQATAAYLDTPVSVAVDSSGNLFIADSHNQRIRKVSQGIITTVAGSGVSGYAGDGGAATSAQLARPSGVALDANGNLYIADTNNQRIRRVSGGVITTVAGNGEEFFAGDNGPAVGAALDQPTSIALDSAGKLYIADKNNQRVRVVDTSGVITTLAGNGSGAFSGAFAGDGGTATAASLAKPVSVATDAAGNLYVADTNNQRIRQISPSGVISTVAGTGEQGYAGENGPALAAVLNSPRGVASGSTSLLSIADTSNQRLRTAVLGQLNFSAQNVGTVSSPQSITISNTGNAPLQVSSLTLKGPFSAAAGGTCTALPTTLAAGASCTQNVAFQPTAPGQASGSATVAGQGQSTQVVLLAGLGAGAPATTLLLAADKQTILSGEALTLTATLTSGNAPATIASGSVSFFLGTQLLGTSTLNNGKAVLSTSALPTGAGQLTATYIGTPTFATSTSSAVTERVADLSFALTATGATIAPGQTVAVPLTIGTQNATGISGTVALGTQTLPGGLVVSFSPANAALAEGQSAFIMHVTAPSTSARNELPSAGAGGIVLALFSIPFWRKRRGLLPVQLRMLAALLTLTSVGLLAGCGANNGFLARSQKSYNITITATATDSTGGTLTRSTTLPITVQ